MKIDTLSEDKRNDIDELLMALLHIDNIIELRSFLGDLFTEAELLEFSNRWKIARMLRAGLSYKKIERYTGVSSATVARIRRCMKEGDGGFDSMFKKMLRDSD